MKVSPRYQREVDNYNKQHRTPSNVAEHNKPSNGYSFTAKVAMGTMAVATAVTAAAAAYYYFSAQPAADQSDLAVFDPANFDVEEARLHRTAFNIVKAHLGRTANEVTDQTGLADDCPASLNVTSMCDTSNYIPTFESTVATIAKAYRKKIAKAGTSEPFEVTLLKQSHNYLKRLKPINF